MINKGNIKLKFDNSFNGRLFAVQGDTGRVFHIEILDDLDTPVDISGMNLKLYVGNSKEVSYSDGEIVEAETGKIKVQVYNSQLKYPGKQKAQFVLTDKNGQKIGSKIFDLWVEEGLEAGPTVGRNIYVDFEKINETLGLIKDYDKTLEEAKEVDMSLKVGIKEGTEINNNLVECKKKALEIKGQLDESKVSANKTLENLKTTKIESETLKSNLVDENNKATQNIRDLSEKNEVVKSFKSELDKSIEDSKTNKINLDEANEAAITNKKSLEDATISASNTNTTLSAIDTEAKRTESAIKELMSKLNTIKGEVSQLIASGHLDEYITDPKLQEVLKSYTSLKTFNEIMTSFEKVIGEQGKRFNRLIGDYVNQFNDRSNAMEVQVGAVVLDIKNKVDKVDGKGLSTNDFTNEYKDKLDKLKTVQLVNDLISGGADKALSAEQGKVLFQYASDGKEKIAGAITGKGIESNKNETFEELSNKITKIITRQTTDGKPFNTISLDLKKFIQNNKDRMLSLPAIFNTSMVTDMGFMFGYCENLTTLDLSSFDTSKVTNMGTMFGGCKNLTTLDLSSFDTSKVTDMGFMFGYCKNLTTLDLSSFDTSMVTDMAYMFRDCKNLTTLDLSSFDTSMVTDMGTMFGGCKNLKIIYARTEDDAQKFRNSDSFPLQAKVIVKNK